MQPEATIPPGVISKGHIDSHCQEIVIALVIAFVIAVAIGVVAMVLLSSPPGRRTSTR
jgi:hypothetical protein